MSYGVIIARFFLEEKGKVSTYTTFKYKFIYLIITENVIKFRSDETSAPEN